MTGPEGLSMREGDPGKEVDMFKKILYCTAFEEFYLDVLTCLLEFKEYGTEEIIVAHVISSPLFPKVHEGYFQKVEEMLRNLFNAKMAEAAKVIEGAGIRAGKRMELGITYQELLRIAHEEDVSLIVSGRERKGVLGEALIGSVTDQIVHHGTVPVYIPKHPLVTGIAVPKGGRPCEKRFRRVLYPTDWSDCARNALNYLKGLKAMGVGEVVVAHVMNEKAMKLQPEERFEEFKRIDLEKLEEVNQELQADGFDATTHLLIGDPRGELIKLASQEDVSVVVMGTHGKGRLEGLLWGCVSRYVTEFSDRPVLLVKGGECAPGDRKSF